MTGHEGTSIDNPHMFDGTNFAF
jgi:hypothetical protein